MITGWSAEAFNQSPDSANEIHGDKIAKQYGFKGGLVPGVTVSAYLTHPAVCAWGMDFLKRGFAHVRVASPLYDREQFAVNILTQTDNAYTAELTRPDGTVSATSSVNLPELTPKPPMRRGDVVGDIKVIGPAASFANWEKLQQSGCRAFRFNWGVKHRMQTYTRDEHLMPDLLTGAEAFANMGFILGTSNWVLAANAYMNPWVHLETHSQNYAAINMQTAIIAELTVLDFYEKKGHEFVDADVTLFDERDDACLATIRIRAIYKLRGM